MHFSKKVVPLHSKTSYYWSRVRPISLFKKTDYQFIGKKFASELEISLIFAAYLSTKKRELCQKF